MNVSFLFRRSQQRRIQVPLLIAVLGLVSAHVQATTMTETLDFRLNSSLSTASLDFTDFDTGLGTLQSTTVSFDATRRHSWAIWNINPTPSQANYDAQLSSTVFTMDTNAYAFADLQYGPGTTPTLAPTPFPQYLAEFLAANAQFLSGADPLYPVNAFSLPTEETLITDSFIPVGSLVSLNIAYSYDPGLFSIDSTGFFVGSLVDVYGSATVTYEYSAFAVPNGSLGAAAGIGLAIILVSGLFRRPSV